IADHRIRAPISTCGACSGEDGIDHRRGCAARPNPTPAPPTATAATPAPNSDHPNGLRYQTGRPTSAARVVLTLIGVDAVPVACPAGVGALGGCAEGCASADEGTSTGGFATGSPSRRAINRFASARSGSSVVD